MLETGQTRIDPQGCYIKYIREPETEDVSGSILQKSDIVDGLRGAVD